MSDERDHRTILIERRGAVGIVTLNRPQALNALNKALVAELASAIDEFERDDAIGAIVLTGNDKAFAAGADVKEMAGKTYPETYLDDFITDGWERVAQCRKPVVAAVAGFALGGGCEIAMMCDIVVAADTARFGQPEITLGTIPGAGGTQRLARFVGKAKAMDLCLTGPDDGRRRGRARRPRQPHRAGRGLADRGGQDRRADQRDVAADRDDGQGIGQPRL